MHPHTGGQTLGADGDEVSKASVDKRGHPIRRLMDEHEENGGDAVCEPTVGAKGRFPEIPIHIDEVAHEKAPPENLLNKGHDHHHAKEPRQNRKPEKEGLILEKTGIEAGIFTFLETQVAQPLGRCFLVPIPEIEEVGGQDPHRDPNQGGQRGDAKAAKRPERVMTPEEQERRPADQALEGVNPLLG